MTDWRDVPMRVAPLGVAAWVRVLWRGALLAVVTYGCLLVLLFIRLVEWPLCGAKRPVTPFITQVVCRMAFVILGLRLRVRGTPMQAMGAVVANHSSWLDIFALNACQRVYFVAKAEVSRWPGIGWLARATGTVFIRRRVVEAKVHSDVLTDRLQLGHKLLFFPEGTSTDTARVLPFKSTLFEAFFTADVKHDLQVQPVTVIYHAPAGQDARYYGWWGDMDFAPHLLLTLATAPQGMVEVVFHAPVRVADFAGRKDLAAWCERQVRSVHPGG